MEKCKKKDRFQFWNDDPTVLVKDNNIDIALKLLKKRLYNAKACTPINVRLFFYSYEGIIFIDPCKY